MKKITKQAVVSIPILGSFISLISAITNLPRKNREIYKELSNLDYLIKKMQQTNEREKTETENKIGSLLTVTDNLSQKILLTEKSQLLVSPDIDSGDTGKALFAKDHSADVFYGKFEDKFRGTEEVITARLKADYQDLFKKSKVNHATYPVLDIGSGRGEFLSLMKSSKINALGLDINIDMVERAKSKGLDSRQGDAVSYLQKTKPQSLGAITGFHIVEHIPFSQLLRLFSAAFTALTKNGFVLFETPNPENILVSTHSFYLDPSHLNPVPPELLEFTLQSVGFTNVQIIRLHPAEKPSDAEDESNIGTYLSNRIYGPRDYAVIAYK